MENIYKQLLVEFNRFNSNPLRYREDIINECKQQQKHFKFKYNNEEFIKWEKSLHFENIPDNCLFICGHLTLSKKEIKPDLSFIWPQSDIAVSLQIDENDTNTEYDVYITYNTEDNSEKDIKISSSSLLPGQPTFICNNTHTLPYIAIPYGYIRIVFTGPIPKKVVLIDASLTRDDRKFVSISNHLLSLETDTFIISEGQIKKKTIDIEANNIAHMNELNLLM